MPAILISNLSISLQILPVCWCGIGELAALKALALNVEAPIFHVIVG